MSTQASLDSTLLIDEILEEIDIAMPGLSVDCVILGYDEQHLHVLLLKLPKTQKWALPGGYVRKEENLDQAALRTLQGRTGLSLSTLRQFKVFSEVCRANAEQLIDEIQSVGIDNPKILSWIKQRFISVGYIALVNLKQCNPVPDQFSVECSWHKLDQLPPLLFDHQEIAEEAMAFLRTQINYLPIGIKLLPEKFTMKDLQKLYEAILGRELDRANFQRKFLKLGILIRHEKQMNGGSHKAPYLYSFDQSKYNEFLESGIGFIF